jgi:hypothetical protein
MKSELIKILDIVKTRPTRVTLAESLGEKFYNSNNLFARPVFTLDCEFGTIWAHTPRVYKIAQELFKKYKCDTLLTKTYEEKIF